ncbi:hypothetical protein OAK81_00340 [Verrucomicrobiales bacterium]|nr:hypothetical protein [Verrucomicrobiales bacterium]MDC0291723.1 hypothetical protein [Verrucomicrobiales bacterium]
MNEPNEQRPVPPELPQSADGPEAVEPKKNTAVQYLFGFLAFIGIGLLGRAFGAAFGPIGFFGLLAYGSFYWAYLGFKGRFPLSPGMILTGTAGKVVGAIFLVIGGLLVWLIIGAISNPIPQ